MANIMILKGQKSIGSQGLEFAHSHTINVDGEPDEYIQYSDETNKILNDYDVLDPYNKVNWKDTEDGKLYKFEINDSDLEKIRSISSKA